MEFTMALVSTDGYTVMCHATEEDWAIAKYLMKNGGTFSFEEEGIEHFVNMSKVFELRRYNHHRREVNE